MVFISVQNSDKNRKKLVLEKFVGKNISVGKKNRLRTEQFFYFSV